jgi:hypothetical protein
MKAKTSINMQRLALGGAAAAVVIFLITGVINGALLSSQFESWMHEMGSLAHPPAQSVSMSLWTLMCVIYGMCGTWLYVAIRPRYGAGPKTALLAGFVLWIVSKLATALDLIALGIVPQPIIVAQLIGGLVTIVAGVFVGAWIYRE